MRKYRYIFGFTVQVRNTPWFRPILYCVMFDIRELEKSKRRRKGTRQTLWRRKTAKVFLPRHNINTVVCETTAGERSSSSRETAVFNCILAAIPTRVYTHARTLSPAPGFIRRENSFSKLHWTLLANLATGCNVHYTRTDITTAETTVRTTRKGEWESCCTLAN